jgi:endonuclease/exonuclease/phosphatase family metal-dependent hydrolase
VTIRILSYNIHKGVCYYTRKAVLGLLRQGLREINPDIVFLQEVKGQSAKSSLGPQFEYLAEELWPHFSYGKNAVYSEGHHGNAILSKYPIIFQHNLDISTNRMERRGMLHAQVDLPKFGPLDLFCMHLDLLERGREQQMKAVVNRIQSTLDHPAPMIMAGDFNDWRVRISQRLKNDLDLDEAGLITHGRHAKTFPAMRPTWALDRIYFRGAAIGSYQVLKGGIWQHLSDHLAVTAEVKLRSGPVGSQI